MPALEECFEKGEIRLSCRSRGLGDTLFATTVAHELKALRSELRVLVESHWPQLFYNNRDVDATFPMRNEPHPEGIEVDYRDPWPPSERKHVLEIVSEPFGISQPRISTYYTPTPEERGKARLIRPPSSRPLLVVHPFSGFFAARSKQWDFRHWKNFLESIPPEIETLRFSEVEDPATPTERPNHREMVGMDLRLIAAILQSADAFVGQESGLAHLATALGVPSVILFTGYVPPDVFGYEQNVNLVPDLPYAPCWDKDGCAPCRAEICTRAIQAETVCEKTLQVLEQSLSRSRSRLW